MDMNNKSTESLGDRKALIFILREFLIEAYIKIIIESNSRNELILPDEEKFLARFFKDFLSSLYLKAKEAKSRGTRKKIKEEIEEIYSAVKMVGFSGRIGQAEGEWQDAAINRFDDSKKGFSYVKREYLQDKNLYTFRPGHEKADFMEKLMIKVLPEIGFKKISRNFIREIEQSRGKPDLELAREHIHSIIKLTERAIEGFRAIPTDKK